VTTGLTASITVSATGLTASTFSSEVDLATGVGGDLLAIDAAGDALIVTGAITFSGGTASFVAPDYFTALETEGWVALETEDGRLIVTEGS
jgi:hypothetical protein